MSTCCLPLSHTFCAGNVDLKIALCTYRTNVVVPQGRVIWKGDGAGSLSQPRFIDREAILVHPEALRFVFSPGNSCTPISGWFLSLPPPGFSDHTSASDRADSPELAISNTAATQPSNPAACVAHQEVLMCSWESCREQRCLVSAHPLLHENSPAVEMDGGQAS